MGTDLGTTSEAAQAQPASIGPAPVGSAPIGSAPVDLAVHALLLRLTGYLRDHVMAEARDALAAGRRLEVARMITFEAMSRPLQLDPDEIDLLRAELVGADDCNDDDRELASNLPGLRGQRLPEPWLFISELPAPGDDVLPFVRPLDLTGRPDRLDAVDRAVLTELLTVPGISAVWRAWRMPARADPLHDPMRVLVVTIDGTDEGAHDAMPELSARVCRAMAAAGDPTAQVEACWTGLDVPLYQTLARSCGALLWAAAAAVPVRIARAFDGADPDRGPWFDTGHPVVRDQDVRQRLLDALNSAEPLGRSDARMVDVREPERGDVVPLDLRTDGRWIWSEAVAYFLEHHGLAPDPELGEHLLAGDAPAPDEVGLHRALVHLLSDRSDDIAWRVPDAASGDASQAAPDERMNPGSGSDVERTKAPDRDRERT